MYQLDPKLVKDTVKIGQFMLCEVLLSRDANYPWCVLVPMRKNLREIHHLSINDQQQLIRESSHLAEVMSSIFAPVTMNIAALGNMVNQLHIHHVARYEDDSAWPKPIWGAVEAKNYGEKELNERLVRLQSALKGDDFKIPVVNTF